MARSNRKKVPAGGQDGIAGKAQPQPPAVDKTLTKGLQLLEALAESEESRGISELALQLSLTKSNVHRLLQTLSKCGYVAREVSTERYLLSTKLWRISRRGRPYDALRRLVRPVLRALADETDESVLFVIVENDEIIPIDQVETQNPVRVFFSIGQSFPVNQVIMTGQGITALQLVALAARPQMEARAAVRKMQKQLQKSEAFADAQMSQIAEARKSGFAASRGEWVAGANAVAVPVPDAAGHLIGVLSCFGPADRLPDARLKKIQKTLAVGAQRLTKRISA